MDTEATPIPVEASASSAPIRRRWACIASTGLSALMCLAMASCYLGRPDAFAAITVFPVWAWFAPGVLLAALGLRRRGNRRVVSVIAAWFLFLLAFAEEPWSLARLAIPLVLDGRAANGPDKFLRVVSLNCNIGSRRAVEEVAAYRPDIVLLQECPGRGEVEESGKVLFGADAGIVSGADTALIVRGTVVPADLPPKLRSYFVQARVRLAAGIEIEVISTRLVPAVFRADLWSPACWREQRENRRSRREQLRVIARRLDAVLPSIPVIVGGDFNAPQGDAVFRVLQPRLHDTFRDGGWGWGDTIINDLPFLRIDQVWVSGTFQASRVFARKTRHSDHRMVICDLAFPQRPRRSGPAVSAPPSLPPTDRAP